MSGPTLARNRLTIGLAIALTVGVVGILAPASSRAETSAGQASAYTALADDVDSCVAYSPLFINTPDGKASTLILHNAANQANIVAVRLAGLSGDPVINRQVSLGANARVELAPSDLSVPSDFSGSLRASALLTQPLIGRLAPTTRELSPTARGQAPTTGWIPPTRSAAPARGPATARGPAPARGQCGLAALVYHDGVDTDRILAEAFSEKHPNEDVWLPAVHRDDNDVNTEVIIQNADTGSNVTVLLKFRGDSGELVEGLITIPSDSAVAVDMAAAPRGASTLHIEGPTNARLVATAYHRGPMGMGAASNGVTNNASHLGVPNNDSRVALPLLFRAAGDDGAYNSIVRVARIFPGAGQPRITLRDRDTGEQIGPIPATRSDGSDFVAAYGEGYTWDLTRMGALRDGGIYSAEVDSDIGGAIAVTAGHINAARGTLAVYTGVPIEDAPKNLVAPLVANNRDGLNSGIQIQNLGDRINSVTVRFLNSSGNRVTAETTIIEARQSKTVYLPATSLPDGFIGSAEISGSGPIAAVVNTVRYR